MAFDLNAAIGGGANVINLASGFNKLAQDIQFGDQERQEALKARQLQNEAAQLNIDTAQFNLDQLQNEVKKKEAIRKFKVDSVRMQTAKESILSGVYDEAQLRDLASTLNADGALATGDLQSITASLPHIDKITKNATAALQGNDKAATEVKSGLAAILNTKPEQVVIREDGVYVKDPNGGTSKPAINFNGKGAGEYLKNMFVTSKLTAALDKRLTAAKQAAIEGGTDDFADLIYKDAQTRQSLHQILDLTTDKGTADSLKAVLALKDPDTLNKMAPAIITKAVDQIGSMPAKAAGNAVDSLVAPITAKYGKDYASATKAFEQQFNAAYVNDPRFKQVVDQSGLSKGAYLKLGINAIQTNSSVILKLDEQAAHIKQMLADANMKNTAASKSTQQGERARELTNQMNGLQQQRVSYEKALTELNDTLKTGLSTLTEKERADKKASIEAGIKSIDAEMRALRTEFLRVRDIQVPQGGAIPVATASPTVSKEDLLKQPVKPFGVKQALPIEKKSDILNPKNKVNTKPKYDKNKG